VQAYQEPFAIEMMENSRTLIADYAVAPVNQGHLRAMILKEQVLKQSSTRQDEKSPDSELIEQLSKLATEDELTGLKNRRYVREFVRQIIERAQVENIRLTLFFFDVDDFKHYNDVYGHATGDEILKQTAIIMRRSCRKHDVVGRIGGDEFAVVFWDNPKEGDIDEERRNAQADHPKQIFFLAERFRKQMHQAHLNAIGPEGKGTLTISGGLAGYPRDGVTVDELFDRADKALYEAKRAGKNAIYLVGEPQA
jgi:diguanylate cyclase (GGDEF)-like protein